MTQNRQRAHVEGGLRILVVEDESLIGLLFEDMLTDLGHQTIGPVGQLNKALKIVETLDADLAILDINIGGGFSYPIAAALSTRGIPFIISTGYAQQRVDKRYCDAPVLKKPFKQIDLQRVISTVFGGTSA